jgi:hypothetical protein
MSSSSTGEWDTRAARLSAPTDASSEPDYEDHVYVDDNDDNNDDDDDRCDCRRDWRKHTMTTTKGRVETTMRSTGKARVERLPRADRVGGLDDPRPTEAA